MKKVYSYIFNDERSLFLATPSFVSNREDKANFERLTVSVIVDEKKKLIKWIVCDGNGYLEKKKTVFMNVVVNEEWVPIMLDSDCVIGKWKQPFLIKIYDRCGTTIDTLSFTNPEIYSKKRIKNRYLFEMKYEN